MSETGTGSLSVLIIDDEEQICKSLRGVLEPRGIGPVHICTDSREAVDLAQEAEPSLILLDLTMPHKTGREVLKELRAVRPEIPVIIITGINEVEVAVECIRLGARDYLVKAIENNKLLASVGRVLEIEALKQEAAAVKERLLSDTLANPEAFSRILTQSQKMKSLFLYLEAVAPSGQPVLIRGETGTGKEEVAAVVHRLSRREGEYIRINVAGLDDTMFSDTLFGHRRGAFSGAADSRRGLIARAGTGTLFLDEIGELSLSSQVKLLRLLESGEYYPLGSDVVRRAGCRIVAATNRPLEELVAEGSFRRDLYYRLKVHEVEIPPLRRRWEDLPLLVTHFLKSACEELNRPLPRIPLELYPLLSARPFPGNIRELKGMIYDAASMNRGSDLSPDSFHAFEEAFAGPGMGSRRAPDYPENLPTLKEAAEDLIEEALRRSGGNISRAAESLGISQSALSQRLLKHKKTNSPL